MKHKDEIYTGLEMIDNLFGEHTPGGCGDWSESDIAEHLGIRMLKKNGEEFHEIDIDEIKSGWWRVHWPEHVLTPAFNQDATYHGPFESRAAAE